jgi:hypothetical protein
MGAAAEVQAWPVAVHGVLRILPKKPTTKIMPLTGRVVFVHVLGQLAELFRGHAQRLG